MIKSGNISGLTSEGGRIGEKFSLMMKLKETLGFKEEKNLIIIRGIGGASGI